MTRIQAFYHVCCMNNWRDVFHEQYTMVRRVGLPVSCFVLGNDDDRRWVEQYLPVLGNQPNLGWYETPTLDELHKWSQKHTDCGVVYFHTKGVSKPWRDDLPGWRRLMMDRVVEAWKTNAASMSQYDVIGAIWRDDHRGYNHFAGNFWAARADWCARLTPPWQHREQHTGRGWLRHKRMHAECWLCSSSYYHHLEV